MDDIEAKVVEFVARVYRVDPAEITLDTNIRDKLSHKSMLMVALVSSIENEIDVLIPISQTAQLRTVGDFVNKVKEELAA